MVHPVHLFIWKRLLSPAAQSNLPNKKNKKTWTIEGYEGWTSFGTKIPVVGGLSVPMKRLLLQVWDHCCFLADSTRAAFLHGRMQALLLSVGSADGDGLVPIHLADRGSGEGRDCVFSKGDFWC
ncbi:hypothetical protein CDAR_185601 [Caerostris darwini]|uniref:Uncharacterized protein n=1 Tax=Caerostris darwini TaxID=1538125 RepID=A0AAV4TC28_9ARAC|nr:hypothetical protein CDAR_185601 [Caerostris darwini]